MKKLELKILSNREENSEIAKNVCYLCEGSLEDYVNSVPEFYAEYEVQRGIVKNIYLDKLAQTILDKKFIPTIVLIADSEVDINGSKLILNNYKILDGLQRTFRIKAVYSALNLFIREKKINNIDFENISKLKLSKDFKKELEDAESDTNVLWTICQTIKEKKYTLEYVENIFKESLQWFEIWTKLDKQEQINKMLVLNAGHKPMNIKHQLELIFLNIIPSDYLVNFDRAKDINSSSFYKEKKEGELHLSHFISALLSFEKQEPVTVDTKFIQYLQDNLETELENIKIYFNETNLKLFINFMKKLDSLFNKEYPVNTSFEGGLSWLGRETVLIGLFAAFGRFYKKKCTEKTLEESLELIEDMLKKEIHIFKIDEFNKAKKTSIDITKVNIGNIFKKTSFNAMSNYLIDGITDINWEKLFNPIEDTKNVN